MSGRSKSRNPSAFGDCIVKGSPPLSHHHGKTSGGGKYCQLEPPRAKSVDQRQTGSEGKEIALATNHYELEIKLPGSGIVHHYDATFTTNGKKEFKKGDQPILIQAMEMVTKKYSTVFSSPFEIVFDGQRNVYTLHELPLGDAGNFIGQVKLRESEDLASETTINVTLHKVSMVDVQTLLEEYVRRGTTACKPNNAIQILNVVMGMTAQQRYETVGRCYFNDLSGRIINIGNGKSLWVGTFQSVRLGWKPMLNLDIANKPAYFSIPMVNFVTEVLKRSLHDVARGMDKRDCEKIQRELTSLKIRFVRPNGQKRDYRVNKLVAPANRQMMTMDRDGKNKKMTIEEYFSQEYNYKLMYPDLPCLHVGKVGGSVFLPMELTYLKKQVLPRNKKLTDEEVASMIRQTAVPPAERQQRIKENLKKMNDSFKSDPYAQAFGIKVKEECISVQGRVLTPPVLGYSKNGAMQEQQVMNGRWDRCKTRLGFVMSVYLKSWGLFDLANVRKDEKKAFVDALYTVGKERNLTMDYPTYQSCQQKSYDVVLREFKNFVHALEQKSGYKPQLVMVISPCKGPLYSLIKHTGDVVLGIPTQFVLVKNVVTPKVQVMHNICMKLNTKLGGINQVIHEVSRPPLLERPVMFMGADVTHPTPDQSKFKPSIAAVVASTDPNAVMYNCEIRLQSGDGAVEVIQKMEDMTKKLLWKFYEQSGFKCRPEKIFYYRDGVSEGQFLQVLKGELQAMRRACHQLNKSYEPQITFLVAQKRHNTRFFPKNPSEGFGKMGNIPPGTVVDTVITHPTEQSFFLASHEGIQGTTKPTSYHVLWDDSNLQPDDLQKLTYYLCHLYPRCERTVSYPAPTYLAHLAAFRGREHHNAIVSKGQGSDAREMKRLENISFSNYFV